jgi:hypothetical protein
MKTNNRLVLINTKNKTVTVFEDKIALAEYEFTTNPFSKEDIEFIRIADYSSKA